MSQLISCLENRQEKMHGTCSDAVTPDDGLAAQKDLSSKPYLIL